MKIYVLASSVVVGRSYVYHLGRISPQYHEAEVIFVDVRQMQGVRFGRGDELHILSGYGQRDDAQAIDQGLQMASYPWVPTKIYLDGNWTIARSRQGYAPAPRLDDAEAVRQWLDA